MAKFRHACTLNSVGTLARERLELKRGYAAYLYGSYMYLSCLVSGQKTKLWLEILSTVHVELDDFFLTAVERGGGGEVGICMRLYLVHTLTFVHVFSARREWHSSILRHTISVFIGRRLGVCIIIRAFGSGATGVAQAAPLFMPIFFVNVSIFVRVRRGPRGHDTMSWLYA